MRSWRFFLLLSTALGFCSHLLAQDQIVYDNALENGWQSYGWATLNYANASPVHSGNDSISVVDPSGFQALYLHHTASNSSLYQGLTFWIYPTKASTKQLNLQATVSGSAQPAVQLSFSASQVNSWQQITVSMAALGLNNNPNFDGFWLQNNSSSPLTFYIDDIALVAQPPPAQIQVTVNPQSVVRTIDSRIFGVNVAIWDSLLSGSGTAPALAAMNTQIIRFPGGSASDDYDWQTGKTASTGGSWVNNAATFAKLVASRGMQAFVTVDYGSGTPEQAAAWVAYYNASTSSTVAIGVDSKSRDWKTAGYWASFRAAAPLSKDDGFNFLRLSRSAPFAIRYWEIGNECYGSWETDLHGTSGSGLTGVAHDPFTYAQAFQSYVTKMTAVDPTIRIGAVSTPGEDSYGIGTHPVPNPNEGNSTHTGWSAVMLATLKSEGVTPNFLIHHSYAQNPGNETDAGLLQSGSALLSDAANLRQMINDYMGAAQGSSIELNVTELNSVSSNPGKQSVSLVNALFMVDAIGNLAQTEFNACTWWDLRNGSGSGNNSSSLYGWRLFGDYGVVASGDRSDTPANAPYPVFYASELLTGWGRGGDRVVSASTNYPLLSAYAAKLANGNIAVLVVNKHPSNDLNAQISLASFTPGSSTATISTYGKSNDLANGGLSQSTFSPGTGSFTYTFPSYSMSLLVIESQYEAWREAHFTSAQLANAAISGDSAEPASDGLPNLLKYAFGLNPNIFSASGSPSIGTQVLSGKSYLTLSFTQPSTLTDIVYTVQVSSDLQTWQSGASYTVRTDNGSTNQATYRDLTAIQDAPRRFIRLSVSRP